MQVARCRTLYLTNPFTPKSDFIDFNLSNARRFYSSKGDPSGVKGLREFNKKERKKPQGFIQ